MQVVMQSDFHYVLCQPGAERALKRWLARTQPALRPSYERRGLVTLRAPSPLPLDAQLSCPLAHVAGVSLGLHASVASCAQRLAELPSKLRLQVFERRDEESAEQLAPSAPTELEQELDAALRSVKPELFLPGQTARPDELVLDVIAARDEPLLLGVRRLRSGDGDLPGGRYAYEVPPDAPSRAYRKLEEAVRAFELPLREGDTALELGAAPGGAAHALLRRGVRVFGVDPGEMAGSVLALQGKGGARLTHLRKPMAAVSRAELPASVEWLLLDVHLAPQVALRAAARFAAMFKRSLCGAVLTLKLNDWGFLDQLERFEADAQRMGLTRVGARQLPAHRQEIALGGVTDRGRARMR